MFGRAVMALAGAVLMLGVLGAETAAVRAVAPAALTLSAPGRVALLGHAGALAGRAVAREAGALALRAAAPLVAEALHGATRLAAVAEDLLDVTPARRARVLECRAAASPDAPQGRVEVFAL